MMGHVRIAPFFHEKIPKVHVQSGLQLSKDATQSLFRCVELSHEVQVGILAWQFVPGVQVSREVWLAELNAVAQVGKKRTDYIVFVSEVIPAIFCQICMTAI